MELEKYKALFLRHLSEKIEIKKPVNLYEPIYYILNLGGKRLRPILCLMSCDIFGGKVKDALDAALAIEMFHNFSLIHDDIMDAAPIRRGKTTVHEKWSVNTGILSGDALLVWAKQLLESYDGQKYKSLNTLFTKTALEVCEGQQYDFDFESTFNVNVEQYIEMITRKTAVLVAASLKFGAIIAETSKKDSENIYNYGLNLGIAFQLQDDYLDIYGKEDFGKQKAGDIIENKKTFLFLKTLELANENDRKKLVKFYGSKEYSEGKIEDVIALFNKYKVSELIEFEIEKYTSKAVQSINSLSINKDKKDGLVNFAQQLMERKI
ncbi:polyprenyl synthetase family protein [Aureibaculum sp. 2210JD6-5]|uniref:polyprenyl synthetase family protein n=1 Tax=Aureibaculum sp. 2210JD6-5 TaxID=3103957 RepID=UPI002AAD58E2|nr:polyprenyl synthetase family protein [Aureibaculum sp. 2210JD6-5]MDY7396000.1 polyprenyl synthetase family protein [Aureibaculum sp. 2210JD6-5]